MREGKLEGGSVGKWVGISSLLSLMLGIDPSIIDQSTICSFPLA